MGVTFFSKDREKIVRLSYSRFYYFKMKILKSMNVDIHNDTQEETQKMNLGKNNSSLIKFLGDHDCKARIRYYECKRIYEIIQNVISNWIVEDLESYNANRLIELMKYCSDKKQTLIYL